MGKTYKNSKRNKRNTRTKKNKKLKKVMCSPDIKDNKFSCYSNENLFILKKYWNQNNDDKIKTNDPKEIWKELKIKHNNDCNKESCWLQKSPIPSKDKNEAKSMLKMFAGNSHDVITSVGFLTKKNFEIITETTEVTYKLLTEKEIDFYVETINPIDKAGSYGIQDWIGMIGVENVNGSYTSVLGLPVPQVTNKLIEIINGSL